MTSQDTALAGELSIKKAESYYYNHLNIGQKKSGIQMNPDFRGPIFDSCVIFYKPCCHIKRCIGHDVKKSCQFCFCRSHSCRRLNVIIESIATTHRFDVQDTSRHVKIDSDKIARYCVDHHRILKMKQGWFQDCSKTLFLIDYYNLRSLSPVLCILTSEQVLCTPFAGKNHLFGILSRT